MHALGVERFELGGHWPFESTIGERLSPDEELVGPQHEHTTSIAGIQMTSSALVHKAVEVRKELAQLVPWEDEIRPLAHQLAEAITTTLQHFCSNGSLFEVRSDFYQQIIFQLATESSDSLQSADDRRGQTLSAKLVKLVPEGLKSHSRLSRQGSMSASDFPPRVSNEGNESRANDELDNLGEYSAMRRESMNGARQPSQPRNVDYRMGTGNWFWENRDLVEEAVCAIEQPLPSGLLTYTFHHPHEAFGAVFGWRCGVAVEGQPIQTGPRARYSFRAYCVSHDGLTEATSIHDFENQVWKTDVETLAATIHLGMSTIGLQLFTNYPVGPSIRTLGCGWDVRVSDRVIGGPDDGSRVKWSTDAARLGNNATCNVRGESSFPDKEGERTTLKPSRQRPSISSAKDCPSINGDDEENMVGVQGPLSGYTALDFYKVWVERNTSQLPRSEILDSQLAFYAGHRPYEPGENYPLQFDGGSPLFGTSVSSCSR
jgi:hypothetical protein